MNEWICGPILLRASAVGVYIKRIKLVVHFNSIKFDLYSTLINRDCHKAALQKLACFIASSKHTDASPLVNFTACGKINLFALTCILHFLFYFFIDF